MSDSTPIAAKGKATQYSSPSSAVTGFIDGGITLSEDANEYVRTTFKSKDDPYLVIRWLGDGVMDALNALQHGNIADPPNPPPFLNWETPE
jgi:hypothetical protein